MKIKPLISTALRVSQQMSGLLHGTVITIYNYLFTLASEKHKEECKNGKGTDFVPSLASVPSLFYALRLTYGMPWECVIMRVINKIGQPRSRRVFNLFNDGYEYRQLNIQNCDNHTTKWYCKMWDGSCSAYFQIWQTTHHVALMIQITSSPYMSITTTFGPLRIEKKYVAMVIFQSLVGPLLKKTKDEVQIVPITQATEILPRFLIIFQEANT